MEVTHIYINTYKYDFSFARICIASIRYWYPDIPIILIKDTGGGRFDTSSTEKIWNVGIFETQRKKFGWGFGKWEPLFIEGSGSFLVLDADTVLVGPVLDSVREFSVDFVVDEEVQPLQRFNEIYYKLDRISEVNKDFVYPGYSFNEGQWFGTSGVLTREDFEPILHWTEPPSPKFPDIILQGAQGHLNYTLHWKEQQGEVTLVRKKIMIWPQGTEADFVDLGKIENKERLYPFIIHWAGFKYKRFSDLPRYDVLRFYTKYYYSKINSTTRQIDQLKVMYLPMEKKMKQYARRINRYLRRP